MAQMMRNYALFDAPHVAIVTAPAELGAYGAMDSGGFVTAFTLAATALGVATIAQAAGTDPGPRWLASMATGAGPRSPAPRRCLQAAL